MQSTLIQYKNLDGEQVEETYWFSLTKIEIMEMELRKGRSVGDMLDIVVKSKNNFEIYGVFKEMLFTAVAKRHEDHLVKSPEIAQKFEGSGAYETYVFALMGDEKAAAEWFESLLPADLLKEIEAKKAEQAESGGHTDEELLAMTESEFNAIAGKDPKKWGERFLRLAFQRLQAKQAASA